MVDIHRFLANLFWLLLWLFSCRFLLLLCYDKEMPFLNALNMIIHYGFHQILMLNVLVVQLAIFLLVQFSIF